MAYVPLTKIPQQFFDNLGNPLVGGTLYAYLAGTSTPTNMFSDNAGTVAGTSVVLDSRGEPTTFKLIWLDSGKSYKFVLKDSTGTTIWTIDNINGTDYSPTVTNFTGNGSTTVFTLAFAPLTENSVFVYVNGVYQQKNTYTVSSTSLTFSEAPPTTSKIEAVYT